MRSRSDPESARMRSHREKDRFAHWQCQCGCEERRKGLWLIVSASSGTEGGPRVASPSAEWSETRMGLLSQPNSHPAQSIALQKGAGLLSRSSTPPRPVRSERLGTTPLSRRSAPVESSAPRLGWPRVHSDESELNPFESSATGRGASCSVGAESHRVRELVDVERRSAGPTTREKATRRDRQIEHNAEAEDQWLTDTGGGGKETNGRAEGGTHAQRRDEPTA